MYKKKVTNVSARSSRGSRSVFLTEVGKLLKPGESCVLNRLNSGTERLVADGVLAIEDGNFPKPPIFTGKEDIKPAPKKPVIVKVAPPAPQPKQEAAAPKEPPVAEPAPAAPVESAQPEPEASVTTAEAEVAPEASADAEEEAPSSETDTSDETSSTKRRGRRRRS